MVALNRACSVSGAVLCRRNTCTPGVDILQALVWFSYITGTMCLPTSTTEHVQRVHEA